MLDDLLSFFTNLALVVPVLPLMMVMVAYCEVRGLWLMVFVIDHRWAGAARGKRAQIITLRNREFVTAAKFSGERTCRSSSGDHAQHDLPGGRGFIAAATGAIVAEAGLVPRLRRPDVGRWGQMLASPTPTARWSRASGSGCWCPVWRWPLLITSLTFINFGVDLLSNPHLREG